MNDSVAMEDNDNALPVKSRILIQPDWEAGRKAWLMVKTPDEPSIRGIFDDAVGSETFEQDGFTVRKLRRSLIGVTHPRAGYMALFAAPSYVWPTIHNKSTICLDVSDGGLGASASSEGDLLVWTTSNGEVRRRLQGHVDAIYACRFFPSGTVLLSGGADFRLKIWSAESGVCAATLLGHRGAINDVAIVERGRNILSCGRDGTVKLWDVGRSHCLHSFNDLAVGVVNAISLGAVESCHAGASGAISSEDQREVGTQDKFLIVAGEGSGDGAGKIIGLDLKSREAIFDLPTTAPTNATLVLNERTFVYGLHDGTVAVVDIRNVGRTLFLEKESRGAVLDLKRFSTGFLKSTQDGSVVYVSAKTIISPSGNGDGSSGVVLELSGPECDPVYKVATENGNAVYTACRDGIIRKYLLDAELMKNASS